MRKFYDKMKKKKCLIDSLSQVWIDFSLRVFLNRETLRRPFKLYPF